MNRTQIEALIPHAGSMCLLEQVVSWNAARIECIARSQRASDNPLRADNKLSSICGIEYAAQAMAVHGGLLAAGDQPRRGYIAVLSNIRWSQPTIDHIECLIIKAEKITDLAQGANYSFALFDGDGDGETDSLEAQPIIDGEMLVAYQPID